MTNQIINYIVHKKPHNFNRYLNIKGTETIKAIINKGNITGIARPLTKEPSKPIKVFNIKVIIYHQYGYKLKSK